MKPVRFEGANCTYVAPDCGDLPTRREIEDEYVSVTSVWKPSAEDLEVLNAGGCVCLNVMGGQPPVALWVQEVNILEDDTSGGDNDEMSLCGGSEDGGADFV